MRTISKNTRMMAFVALMSTTIFSAQNAHAVVAVPAIFYENAPTYQDIRIINVSVDEEQAQGFIRNMGQEAIGFLGDSSLTASQKEKKFEALLNKNFDMATIGRFVAGSNWNKMDASQQAEYQELFKSLIVSIYSNRLSDYQGQEFVVDSSRSTSDTDTIVGSYIVPPQGEKVPVKWLVREKNGSQKIVDVQIKDVSMAISKRSEFSSIIQRGGGDPEAILTHLRAKTQ